MKKLRLIAFAAIYLIQLAYLLLTGNVPNGAAVGLPFALIITTAVFMIPVELIADFVIVCLLPPGHPLRRELCRPRPAQKHWATRMAGNAASRRSETRHCRRAAGEQIGYRDPILAPRPWWNR